MNVDGDERLELDPVEFGQFLSCNRDQLVQKFEKLLIGRGHNFLVVARIHKRFFRITSPKHLQT